MKPILFCLVLCFLPAAFPVYSLAGDPPATARRCLDHADILSDIKEGCNAYLGILREDYGIDAMVLTIEELPQGKSVEEMALELFSNHHIGRESSGRGLLLFFCKKEKRVRIEVSYALEDVFTDLFCGFVQDRQLRHYFLAGDIEFGLMAVMEEVEKRAALKHKGGYTPQAVEELDREYLSGGAGTGRNLSNINPEQFKHDPEDYPAGKTPGQAFSTLVRSWKHRVRTPNLGVYTQAAGIAFENYTNQPDAAYDENVKNFDKPFQVIQNKTYAVIHFNKNSGWDNTPFLFAKTPEGWKFDMVNQLKHVRMARNPKWGIEAGNYIYTDLLKRFPAFGENTRDIPLPEKDIYRIKKDRFIAQQIRYYQGLAKTEPDSVHPLGALGRLYAVTSHRKAVKTLKKAIQMNPDDALSLKYLAIALFEGSLEDKSALKYINEYCRMAPDDPFGSAFAGYLNYRLGNLSTAEQLLNQAVSLDGTRSYPYCYLARIYAKRYTDYLPIDPRRIRARKKLKQMVNKAQICQMPHPHRIDALFRFLKKRGLAKFWE